MELIKIINWENLNCNNLLFYLISILSSNENTLIYIKSRYYEDNLEVLDKYVWIKINLLNNEEIKSFERFSNKINKEFFGCLHSCVKNITTYLPGHSKIYQTYNQIFKIEWYSSVMDRPGYNITEIDFTKSSIDILKEYLPNYNYLPEYYLIKNDNKVEEKKIFISCDKFLKE